MEQGHIDLAKVEVFILDEADRMLDMGFVRDVRKVVRTLPTDRQTLLFSATMPDAITELSGSILRNPERVEVTPAATTVRGIDQKVLFVEKGNKRHVSQRDLHRQRRLARHRLHAHQARRQPRRRVAREARRRPRARSTATSPRALGSARWRRSPTARCGRWSPPTSRRAAWTSAR
jgi:ABC-type multidrug transport system ATPase subunit